MPTAVVTVPISDSESLARELVEDRLAASVNRIPCTSTYRWEGEVNRADEEVLLVRTTDELYDDAVKHIQRQHPYEVAPVERYDESDATPEFREWRRRNVGKN